MERRGTVVVDNSQTRLQSAHRGKCVVNIANMAAEYTMAHTITNCKTRLVDIIGVPCFNTSKNNSGKGTKLYLIRPRPNTFKSYIDHPTHSKPWSRQAKFILRVRLNHSQILPFEPEFRINSSRVDLPNTGNLDK